MAAYNRLPQARRYLLRGQGTEKYVRRWVAGVQVAAQRKTRTFFGLAITLKPQDQMIGKVTLAVASSSRRSAQIGWELDAHHWGHGYASEALRALIAYGFEEEQIGSVTADCFAANLTSIRVMQKLGMQHQGDSRALSWFLAVRYREWRPIVRHRLTAEGWRSHAVEQ